MSQFYESFLGLGIFPVIALFIFLALFISILVFVVKIDKSYATTMSNLPIDPADELTKEVSGDE